MKKQILIATGLAVLSTSAFASKARLEALGQNDDRGSFYVEDARNIFRNASKVNTHKNYITTEWGTANDAADSKTTPHAEGGFFREMGSFNYGVYLGSEIDSQNASRVNIVTDDTIKDSGEYNFLKHDNALDLFFGGDMGVQWGARLHYASAKDESAAVSQEHDNFGLGLGMMMGDIEAYANMTLSDESKGNVFQDSTGAAGDKLEGNSLNVGVAYNLMGSKLYADYDKAGYESTIAGAKTEYTETTMTVGVGRIHEVSSTARLNMDIAYVSGKEETKTTSTVEAKETFIPLTLGFEADANSWLVLRGAITQNVLLNTDKDNAGKKTTKANTTTVTSGATLNFGKLKVDGSIGTGTAGTLQLDNLMTRVGVSYWF
ncbi:hypothetical protein [Halobacteriovorax sp.]|uniref:hypothetical protein n=1 Tax=Halobacteriovorax sp. TaxID=2020862 RepID=UPI00356B5130